MHPCSGYPWSGYPWPRYPLAWVPLFWLPLVWLPLVCAPLVCESLVLVPPVWVLPDWVPPIGTPKYRHPQCWYSCLGTPGTPWSLTIASNIVRNGFGAPLLIKLSFCDRPVHLAQYLWNSRFNPPPLSQLCSNQLINLHNPHLFFFHLQCLSTPPMP